MARLSAYQYRRRLLRLLPTDRLQHLHPEDLPNPSLIDIIAKEWNPEVENMVRDCVEGFIVMARAELHAENQSAKTKGFSVVRK